MPLYNAEKTLESSVRSVLNQTYSNLELIIVDDKSTDDSYKIAKAIQLKDERVVLIKLSNNSGAGIARNYAIEQANGNYIAFLDADDQWMPTKIQKQLEAFSKTDATLVCSGYTIVDEQHKWVGNKQPAEWVSYNDLLKSNVIGCLTAIYCVDKIGKVYMPTIMKRQDYGLWLNILKKHGPAYCIQEPLSQYHIQTNSISSNKLEMLWWNYKMFRTTQKFNIFVSGILTLRNAYIKLIRG